MTEEGMRISHIVPNIVGGGQIESTREGLILRVPAGAAGQYRLAQIDDYRGLARREFPRKPPVALSLRARISPGVTTGTWGFGFWNDPFGLGLNPVESGLTLPTPPQAAWFFWASEQSFLSFRDDLPANGLRAQVFRSATGWNWLLPIGLQMLSNRRAARVALQGFILEAARQIEIDTALWHQYEVHWQEDQIRFVVDERPVYRIGLSPQGPLGLVLWIDNQCAAFYPDGQLKWQFEAASSECWLEVRDLILR